MKKFEKKCTFKFLKKCVKQFQKEMLNVEKVSVLLSLSKN